jgi:hypothetical protein
MTSKRRLTTDELVAQLLEELQADRKQAAKDRKADREATEKRQREITDRLDRFETALTEISREMRDLRDHVLKHEDQAGKDIRSVADFVGMTIPVKNGGR